jgi:hypothetical protein
MVNKLLAKIITGIMVFSLLTPFTVKGEETSNYQNWDSQRYGDRVDIDAKLDQLSKDDSFLVQAEIKIREQAKKLKINIPSEPKNTPSKKGSNGKDATTDSDESGSSYFTYDGGTKVFLNYELSFKEFTLRSIGDNVEIWVANDLSFLSGDPRPAHVVTQEQVEKLRDEFDSNIYPKCTEFFGMPDKLDGSNSQLVAGGYVPEGYYDGDKIIILVDNIIDENYNDPEYPFFVAGFFWQTIENYIDRNIITIDTNSWETRLESTFFPTTIHELQHLIHSDNDGAEESWINEGMSTFSEFLGGYGHDTGSINFFLDHPENSLVYWDDHYSAATGPETIADYGQVYLFTLYMNDKFGSEFIHDLAVNENQGINSINEVLEAYGYSMDFTDLYHNFITALVLDNSKTGNKLYDIDSIDLRGLEVDNDGTKRGMTVDFESALLYEKEGVPAWGGDFKSLDFHDKIRTIYFDGVDFLPVLWEPADDPLKSGNTVLWGNEGDEADNALIFEADLSDVTAVHLEFDNYIQIEEQWDFGVVQISTDGGITWKSLSNENTRSDLVTEGYPKIKDNLPGFTGYYDGWQRETFDLSAYTGQRVLISFRYLTDWGYNDAGWYIDNIAIPEIGYYNDCSSKGDFMSINEILGQYVDYTVTFINERKNEETEQLYYNVITVDPFNKTEEDALILRQLFHDGNNYMIITYAAPAGDKNPVDFTYEVNLKKTNVDKE